MKRTRSSHVRMKIVALLAALAALWSFAAYVTVRDGMNLLFVNTLGDFGVNTADLIGAVQRERQVSVSVLSGDRATAEQDLLTSRARTDDLAAIWQAAAASRAVGVAASDRLTERAETAEATLADLVELRADVDSGEVAPDATSRRYTTIVDSGYGVLDAVVGLDDQEFARQARALLGLSKSSELLSRGDALLSGALAAGELTRPQLVEFTQLVGAQRHQFASTASELHPDDLALYEQAEAGPVLTRLRTLEDRVLAEADAGSSPPVPAEQWRETVDAALAELRRVELAATDNALQRATPIAIGVIVRLLLAGGLGLIAVIAAVVVSITTARALVRQLERLRDAALEVARRRLPLVVERLSAGEKVDVAAEAPPLRFGNDEIGQVGQAFNAVQETAVRAAVQQAELRRGVRDVFLSLARRTQSLVHKQLSVVDGMERRETDADEMEEIYRIDHLATRMRRNAENLIVLSGASPGRTWRRSVTMIDVIRGAVAEVEDYTRIGLLPVDDAALDGRAVGDVIHLLAELIENAASFSPPYARVSVGGQRVAHGFVVEIEDRGLGMSAADLTAANDKLTDPPDFSLADASRLGHYVVAKLAQRHAIKVHLRPSPYGGVVAIVLIPADLLADASGGLAPSAPEAAPVAEVATPEGLVAAPGVATPEVPAAAEVATPGVNGARVEGLPATLVRQRRAPEPPPATSPSPPPPSPPLPAAPSPPALPPQAEPPPAAPPLAEPLPAAPPPAEPPPAGAALSPPAVPEARTPSGLPWRVRQASLPKQLQPEGDLPNGHHHQDTNAGQRGPAAPAPGSTVDEPPERDPEQVREMMRAYQHGTKLGRNRAAAAGQDDLPAQEG